MPTVPFGERSFATQAERLRRRKFALGWPGPLSERIGLYVASGSAAELGSDAESAGFGWCA